jgi:hypothetical protein
LIKVLLLIFVDHHIIIDRLSSRFDFRGLTLVWFRSYLSNQRQSLSVSGQFSPHVLLLSGVPQGSFLGPILYNLYYTSIHDISVSHGVPDHQYADDDQKYLSFRISVDGADQRRASLPCRHALLKREDKVRRMKYNDLKTKVMMVYSKYGPEPARIPLTVGDAEIQAVFSLLSLGVILYSHLTMDPQIRSSCKKVFFHLRRLSQIKNFLFQSALSQLSHAFVIS